MNRPTNARPFYPSICCSPTLTHPRRWSLQRSTALVQSSCICSRPVKCRQFLMLLDHRPSKDELRTSGAQAYWLWFVLSIASTKCCTDVDRSSTAARGFWFQIACSCLQIEPIATLGHDNRSTLEFQWRCSHLFYLIKLITFIVKKWLF